MRGRRYESAAVVAVCVGDRLVGPASLEWLLAAASDETVGNVMNPDPPVVEPGADQDTPRGPLCITVNQVLRWSTPVAGFAA